MFFLLSSHLFDRSVMFLNDSWIIYSGLQAQISVSGQCPLKCCSFFVFFVPFHNISTFHFTNACMGGKASIYLEQRPANFSNQLISPCLVTQCCWRHSPLPFHKQHHAGVAGTTVFGGGRISSPPWGKMGPISEHRG